MADGSTERKEKLWFARALEKGGNLHRRDFIRTALLAGFGACLPSLTGCRRPSVEPPGPRQLAGTLGSDSVAEKRECRQFLEEMGRRFAGTRLRIISEDTPPSIVTRQIMLDEFIPATGIEVEWDILPLDRVLAKISSDTARKIGTHDVYYIDQQWVARFADDMVDPRTLLERTDIAYPDYDFGDILPELVDHLARYGDRLVGVPYDVSIEIMIYRRDILARLGLHPPRTRAEFLAAAREITADKGEQAYGTSGMWKAGHLSLYIEFVSLLWSFGGSIYLANGEPALNDAAARATLDYMVALSETMSPAVTTWDWASEAESFANGETALLIQPGEYLAMLNDPTRSQVAGRVDVARCPRATSLRPPEACGFSEHPNVSHQGGSLLGISRYSRSIDAAWVLVQWATSSDVVTRASILGGGSSPIRNSTYRDPRIVASSKVLTSPTHHFPVSLEAILYDMGSDPMFPLFPDIAVHGLAGELGKFTTGQQSARTTAEAMEKLARVS